MRLIYIILREYYLQTKKIIINWYRKTNLYAIISKYNSLKNDLLFYKSFYKKKKLNDIEYLGYVNLDELNGFSESGVHLFICDKIFIKFYPLIPYSLYSADSFCFISIKDFNGTKKMISFSSSMNLKWMGINVDNFIKHLKSMAVEKTITHYSIEDMEKILKNKERKNKIDNL